LLAAELDRGRADDRFPLAPARIVADTRTALRRNDIILVDTGALKMWLARLYPTYEPNTCLISSGLSTMAWTLPRISAADQLLPTLRKGLNDDTVSVIACPVDYSDNNALIPSLGELDESLS
jgi:thiamine pyrophosphate-dependent acetolactate synthase large subunit-like protein